MSNYAISPVNPAVFAAPLDASTSVANTGREFDDLFNEEYRPLVRLASLLLSDKTRAEEVVQDAFCKAHLRFSRLDNPAGFLRACVVNACKSEWRRHAVLRKITPKVIAGEKTVSHDAPHELLDAVAALSPKKRAVVVLRFYEDRNEEEIAQLLSIPKGTVKSTLHRALADLRTTLGRESEFEGDTSC